MAELSTLDQIAITAKIITQKHSYEMHHVFLIVMAFINLYSDEIAIIFRGDGLSCNSGLGHYDIL